MGHSQEVKRIHSPGTRCEVARAGRDRTIPMHVLTPAHDRSPWPMRHARHLVLALIAALIGSNAWWAHQAIDAAITRSYAEVSASDTRQELAQTRALIRAMAK